MKDLINRLRDWSGTSHERNRVDMAEAADAIEKLEAENAALQIRLNVTLDNYGNTTRERDAMRTENTRLKAELAQLRDQKPIGYIYLGGAIDAVGCVVRETAFSGELAIYAAPGANHG